METAQGLTKMLRWASDKGYKKVLLAKGTYLLDQNTTVQMATHLILDMNGATFKMNPGSADRAMMMEMFHCEDSHVVNGIFVGDRDEHDYKAAKSTSEWVDGISMGQGTVNSSYENVTVENIAGSGVLTHKGGNGIKATQYSHDGIVKVQHFSLGDIDTNGKSVSSDVRTTNKEMIDISKYVQSFGFFQLGHWLGYQGNYYKTWVYKTSFYDADKNYIGDTNGYFYRRLYPPENAKYARFTLFSDATPSDLRLFNVRTPYNSAFINVHMKDVRCVGMVPSGFNNLLVEGCTFVNCGAAAGKCAFDAEDGWDGMQDLTFRNNTFGENPNNEFLTNCGHNFVLENNTMGVVIRPRTDGIVAKNNNLKFATFEFGRRDRSGFPRIENNVIEGKTRLLKRVRSTHTYLDREYCIRNNVCKGIAESGNISKKDKQIVTKLYFYKCKILGKKKGNVIVKN